MNKQIEQTGPLINLPVTPVTRENLVEEVPREGAAGFYAPTPHLTWVDIDVGPEWIGAFLYQLWTHPRGTEFKPLWVRVPTVTL